MKGRQQNETEIRVSRGHIAENGQKRSRYEMTNSYFSDFAELNRNRKTKDR